MKKFNIHRSPLTTSKSIRFPNDLITQVEHIIQHKNCSFSAYVIQSVKDSLENLEEES